MHRRTVWAAAIAAAGWMACGRGSGVTKVATTHPPPDPNGGDARCDSVTIRLLGVAQGDLSSAHLVLGSVSARLASSGDAIALAGVPSGATLDLSSDAHAFAVGSFRLEDATGPVAVTLSLSGGDAARPAAAGALDVCTGPIELRVDPGKVDAHRCQAIVKLDVGRSIVTNGGALSFLPQFGVAF